MNSCRRLAPSDSAALMRSTGTERTPACAEKQIGAKVESVQQHDLRGLADAQPDDQQRQVGQRRQAPIEIDRNAEDAA